MKAKGQLNVLIPNLLSFLRDRKAKFTKKYTPSHENIVLTCGSVRLFSLVFSCFYGRLAMTFLGPIGRRNRIPRPVMGSDHNLRLDHQTLVSQTPDGRTLQADVGFPLNSNVPRKRGP